MASFNFNKVIIGGRLTADPELKQTLGGVSVTSFNVAVNRRYVKEGETNVDFLNVAAWRGTAEFICKHFKRGSSICIVGSIQVRPWMDQNGNKRYSTEIVADEVYFVDSKNFVAPTGEGDAPRTETYNASAAPQFETVENDSDLPF